MLIEQRIGAHLTVHGCFFRVWAPHAEAVRVLLQRGHEWRAGVPQQTHSLSKSADGYFSGIITQVRAGDLYRFEIDSFGTTSQRLDPAARDVVNSALTRHDNGSNNAGVVVDNKPYPWVPFQTPSFENFLIYQFHVGSFAGRHDHLNKPIATFADVETKLPYIRELGFNAVQPLPVHEFALDRSWGYNPASFFALESAYGTPSDLKHFVNAAHEHGLAVIFDVVYNHAGPGDSVLWEYDGYTAEGGIYFEGGQQTPWGRGPAWWKHEVQDFFYQNARMYLEDYRADGLRFDATTLINGNHLRQVLWRLREDFSDRYLIAEHLPAHPWVTTLGNFNATWNSETHHQTQRALAGDRPVERVAGIVGRGAFEHSWNLVNYPLGSHDDCGDDHNGNAQDGLANWDSRHRYLIDLLGGRHSAEARAKCRMAWLLGVTMPGTPMCFMGSECLLASPHVAWGYWHDGIDQWGDHRFNWAIAGDEIGLAMRALVGDANRLRWEHPALRSDDIRVVQFDKQHHVLAFVREFFDDCVMAVFHFGGEPRSGYVLPTQCGRGAWHELLSTQHTSYGGDYPGAAQPIETSDAGELTLHLPAWSASVWQLTRG
jgi:1,4-alpha-glucan branching enzyme